MIFQKLGGPLSQVFRKMISGAFDEISEQFDFLEITADGLCARIEEQDVFVGNKDYMLSYDFGYTKDVTDDQFEDKAGRIMYMVIGGKLAAKFYIKYFVSPHFEKTLAALYKNGICAAVKTCDPNVDDDLFKLLLKDPKLPATIIKTTDAVKDAPVSENSESGIVCGSSISNMLQTFLYCDSLRTLIRNNVFIKFLSLVLGAGIVVFFQFFAGEGFACVTPLVVLLYQVMWLIPMLIPSVTE